MKAVGVYATYQHNSGVYADLVLKYGLMENDLNVTDTQGRKVSVRSIRTGSYGASLEAGKRCTLIMVSRASSGLKIKMDAYDSVLGRAGANAGYKTTLGDDTKINVYAKVFYVHEFDGNIGVKLNNASIKESFGGDWITYGAGTTLRVAEKHNFYADFEAASAGQFSQPWSVNIGYRFTF